MEARDLFVPKYAEYGICQHMWDISLDAEVCDLIYGETRVQSNALGLQLSGSQGSRCEKTLRVSLNFVRSWAKG